MQAHLERQQQKAAKRHRKREAIMDIEPAPVPKRLAT